MEYEIVYCASFWPHLVGSLNYSDPGVSLPAGWLTLAAEGAEQGRCRRLRGRGIKGVCGRLITKQKTDCAVSFMPSKERREEETETEGQTGRQNSQKNKTVQI